MPSFCQVMVGLGEPVALQGRVIGLLRITSKVGGWDWITGSSEETERKRMMFGIITKMQITADGT